MNNQFATAMGRALDLTRAGSAMEATRLIQHTLNGQTTEPAVSPTSSTPPPKFRRRLGEVVDLLSKARRVQTPQARGPRKRPAVPEGAQYQTRSHSSPFGERRYRLFVPSLRDTSPQGLLLMLHGCTQNAEDFAVGTQMNLVAEKNNLVVIYADQKRAANHMGCWNWFRPEDQGRGAGEPALLTHLTREVARDFEFGKGRVFVAGMSAGGAMATILGQTHPDVFSAVGVHSGLPAGSASDVAGAFAAMRSPVVAPAGRVESPVRTIVFHGSADTTVAPANADAVIAAAIGGVHHSEIVDESETSATVTLYRDDVGQALAEKWSLDGVGHAWSGGSPEGSYTDPTGPDASVEMVRFFLAQGAEAQS